VNILQYFSEAIAVKQFMVWTLGSLSNISWSQLQILSIVVIASLIASFALQKSLNTLSLSENYAKTLGVSVGRLRIIIIVLTSLMAGTITSFAGPIVFIGVAIPHLARGLFKTTNHNILIKASIIIGALVMLICDIISQLPGSYTVFPINSITSIFGAPIIIWIIVKNRRLHSPGF
jgi:iron complex transport system permease protein